MFAIYTLSLTLISVSSLLIRCLIVPLRGFVRIVRVDVQEYESGVLGCDLLRPAVVHFQSLVRARWRCGPFGDCELRDFLSSGRELDLGYGLGDGVLFPRGLDRYLLHFCEVLCYRVGEVFFNPIIHGRDETDAAPHFRCLTVPSTLARVSSVSWKRGSDCTFKPSYELRV